MRSVTIRQSKLVAPIQVLKIAFVSNWQLLSSSWTWCRHEHDAQISALAIADDFFLERRWGQTIILFCSFQGERLSLFLLQLLVPQSQSQQTAFSKQFEISHLRLHHLTCNHLWTIVGKSLACPAFYLSVSLLHKLHWQVKSKTKPRRVLCHRGKEYAVYRIQYPVFSHRWEGGREMDSSKASSFTLVLLEGFLGQANFFAGQNCLWEHMAE